MNGINIPKNVVNTLSYQLVNATDSFEFDKRINDVIEAINKKGYLILNIDIKQPVVYSNHIWHYAHIFYYKP